MNMQAKTLWWIAGVLTVAAVGIKLATKDQENALLQKQLEQARLPEVSVQVSLRKALVASGNVAVFKNTSGQIVAVTAEVERPSSNLRKAIAITLDPGQTKELGGLEGWSFVPGDTIRLSQPGHRPVLVTTH